MGGRSAGCGTGTTGLSRTKDGLRSNRSRASGPARTVRSVPFKFQYRSRAAWTRGDDCWLCGAGWETGAGWVRFAPLLAPLEPFTFFFAELCFLGILHRA